MSDVTRLGGCFPVEILIQVLFVLLLVCCVGIIVSVLLQPVRSSGLGATFGGETDSFYGNNKSKTRAGRLELATKVFAIALGVICIGLAIIFRVRG